MDDMARLRARIKNDVKQCMIKDGRTAEECLDEAVDRYNLHPSSEKHIRESLGDKR